MKSRLLLCLILSLLLPLAALAEPTSMDELCKQITCRGETPVVLTIDVDKQWKGTFPASPFVINGSTVNLVPGETIYLTGTENSGKLTDLKASLDKPEAEPAIGISFRQETEEGKHKAMILEISNPYDHPLKFSAGIMPLGDKNLYKTSSCPILPNLNNHENWPDPILRLVLNDFRLLDETKEKLDCD